MRTEELAEWIVAIVGGFLMGSVMFSHLLPKIFLGKDVTEESDDHNPGATNVFINCGPVWGMICLGRDLLKGFIPTFLALRLLDTENLLFAAVMVAPVLGHALAPFNHFHGGKCIATSFGALLGLIPVNQIVVVLGVIYIVFSTVLKINPNRIRSIAAFGLFGTISLIMMIHSNHYAIAIGCALISLIAIIKHSKYFAMEAYSAS